MNPKARNLGRFAVEYSGGLDGQSRRDEGVGPECVHEQNRTDEDREEASESQSTRGLRLAGIEADYSHQEQQCAD